MQGERVLGVKQDVGPGQKSLDSGAALVGDRLHVEGVGQHEAAVAQFFPEQAAYYFLRKRSGEVRVQGGQQQVPHHHGIRFCGKFGERGQVVGLEAGAAFFQHGQGQVGIGRGVAVTGKMFKAGNGALRTDS